MNQTLTDLPNIGPTIAKRLRSVGIQTPADLAGAGPVEIWKRLVERYPGQTIPVCYYLYSLEGAIRGVHWDDLPAEVKQRLEREARM